MKTTQAIRKISKWTYLLMFTSSIFSPLVYVLHRIWEVIKGWL